MGRIETSYSDPGIMSAAPPPVSVLILALFKVLMSSPRLFLSPFIFQFPPTKNFLGDMSAAANAEIEALRINRPKW